MISNALTLSNVMLGAAGAAGAGPTSSSGGKAGIAQAVLEMF
jgi:hypothetical protein